MNVKSMNWNTKDAEKLYNIAEWSQGYFGINEHGKLMAYPKADSNLGSIDMNALIQDIRAEGLSLPVLIRFNDILHDRFHALENAFIHAMKEHTYQNEFTAVYPIKVNQQSAVVREILSASDKHIGLEAGSKPELLAVLGLNENKNAIIVCNGYKDREFVRLALIGQALGHQVFIIIEKFSELHLVLEESAKMKIEPQLGLRIRLSSVGAGKWQNTGGEKSKFGLPAQQVLNFIDELKAVNKLDALRLLHFHMGSQVANIGDIKTCLKEASRYFVELYHAGANIQCIDVGGGLGVDYEGTRSRNFCSMNYSIQEYANKIIHTFTEACEVEKIPHPLIITESGRAMTAHHAVLVTNVISVEKPDLALNIDSTKNMTGPLFDLNQILLKLNNRPAVESYHDANQNYSAIKSQFMHGIVNLSERANAEKLYLSICEKLKTIIPNNQNEIINELDEKLASKFFCNFSLFQSVPDVWAIDQIFPIMPLQSLDQQPTVRAIIKDITCDSDGRIDAYIDGEGIEKTLPLPPPKTDEEYLLGIFLVGAYQEILGDIHNLFGDTHSVHVNLSANDGYILVDPLHGDTVSDVLQMVNFKASELLDAYQTRLKHSDLSEDAKTAYLGELESGLSGYTYFED